MVNNVITSLFNDKRFNEAANKIAGNTSVEGDLKSEVILRLLETDPEKILSIHNKGELIFYSVGIMLNMFRSNTSRFWRTYRNFDREVCMEGISPVVDSDACKNGQRIVRDGSYDCNSFITEEEEVSENKRFLQAQKKIEEMYWYDKRIFMEYIDAGSYRKLEAKTGIPMKSLQLTCLRVKNKIKENA